MIFISRIVTVSENLFNRYEPHCKLCKERLHVGQQAERKGRKRVYYICMRCYNNLGEPKKKPERVD